MKVLHLRGVPVPALTYGREPGWTLPRPDTRCADCGVAVGGLHHLGCDIARCPTRYRQLLSCGCPYDELGPYDDDAYVPA